MFRLIIFSLALLTACSEAPKIDNKDRSGAKVSETGLASVECQFNYDSRSITCPTPRNLEERYHQLGQLKLFDFRYEKFLDDDTKATPNVETTNTLFWKWQAVFDRLNSLELTLRVDSVLRIGEINALRNSNPDEYVEEKLWTNLHIILKVHGLFIEFSKDSSPKVNATMLQKLEGFDDFATYQIESLSSYIDKHPEIHSEVRERAQSIMSVIADEIGD